MSSQPPPSAHDIELAVWIGCPAWWHQFFPLVIGTLLLPFGVGFLILVGILFKRARLEYVVTGHRIAVRHGTVVKSTREIRIKDIRSINVIQRGMAGWLGIGTIEFSSAADRAEIVFVDIHEVERVRSLVTQLQFAEEKGSIDFRQFNVPPSTPPLRGAAVYWAAAVLLMFGGLAAIVSYGVYRTYQIVNDPRTVLAASVTPTAVRSLPSPARTDAPATTSFPAGALPDVASSSAPTLPATTAATTAAPTPPPAAFFANVKYSQQAAVQKYPQLGVARSEFNTKFLTRLEEWKIRHDPRLERSDWPEKLADDCARQ